MIQVLKKFPTDKIHIKVPQYKLLCHTHVDNKKQQVFEFLLKCVTRSDISGVPLRVQTNLIQSYLTLRLIKVNMSPLGRYSTFQYPDQDPCPENFNVNALFHVSVSVKRIFLYLPYFNLCLHNTVIIYRKMQHFFTQNKSDVCLLYVPTARV